MGTEASTAGGSRDAGIAAWYGLAVMIFVAMAGNLIPQVIGLVAQDMKRTLALSDVQLGALRGVASTLVATLATYPIAWIADRIDRRLVFAACMLFWAAATIGMGFAPDYAALIGFAIGIALGEAVLGPITFAIIPELFPPERRIAANSIFFIAQLLGVAAGLAFGGWLIQTMPLIRESLNAGLGGLDTWRLTIMAAAFPTLVCIPLVLLMRLKKHQKAASTEEARSANAVLPFVRLHARTLSAIFIGFGMLGAANFIPVSWLAVLMIRDFGAPADSVGLMLSQVFAFGSVGGVIGANLLARALIKRNPILAPLRIAQVGAATAALLTLLYPLAHTATQLYILAALQLCASTGALVLSPTVTQNVTPARIRARVIAIGGIFYTVFGALSPVVVGAVSDSLNASGGRLLEAIIFVAVPAFVIGALFLQLAVKSLPATLEAVREEI
jgi:MFS family permease